MLLPTLKIIISSTNLLSLQVYTNFICKILNRHSSPVCITACPVKKTTVTLLKAPHVYKKSKEQYQIKKYRTTILSSAFLCHKILFKFFLLNKPKSVVLNVVLER